MTGLYFRHRRTDAALQPGLLWTVCLWIAAISMIAAEGYQVVQEVLKVVRA